LNGIRCDPFQTLEGSFGSSCDQSDHTALVSSPDLAEWLLDLIERGVFADPSAAVFVMLGEHRDLEPHDDLRHELLQRTVQAAIDDPRPSLSGIEVKAQSRELADTPLPEAAIWRKIP
jgi:antitoxin ParD1/3/4